MNRSFLSLALFTLLNSSSSIQAASQPEAATSALVVDVPPPEEGVLISSITEQSEFDQHELEFQQVLFTRQKQSSSSSSSSSSSDEYLDKVFTARIPFLEWKEVHEKVYGNGQEELERMLVWIKHDEYIKQHNNQIPKSSYTLGHNFFSDMTSDEFQQRHILGKYSPGVDTILQAHERKKSLNKKLQGSVPSAAQEEFRYLMEEYEEDLEDEGAWVGIDGPLSNKKNKLPKSVDWVEAGAVTPIKNQGQCGSCWAFSTTGAIEGAKFIKTGELVSLSEQNLLDCDEVDNGCSGGLMDNAFEFDESFHGLCSEDEYPYLAEDTEACKVDCNKVPGSEVLSYMDIPEGKEYALIKSIVMQPTSIAMQADQLSFQLYSSGVFDNEDCGAEGAIDHGVLAVGYGKDKETKTPYILVKNSWGDSWGEDGYIRLARHSDNEWGMCAILRVMSAPTV